MCGPPPQLTGTFGTPSVSRPAGPLVYNGSVSSLPQAETVPYSSTTIASGVNVGASPIASVTVTGMDLNRNGIPDALEGGFECTGAPPPAPRLTAPPVGSRVVPPEEILTASARSTQPYVSTTRPLETVSPAPVLRSSPSTGQLPNLPRATATLYAGAAQEAFACRPSASAATLGLGARSGVSPEVLMPREPVVATGLTRSILPPAPCMAPQVMGGMNLISSVPWPPPPLPPVPLDLSARVEALESETSYVAVDVTIDSRIKELEIKIAAERDKAANAPQTGSHHQSQWEESMRDLQYQHDDVTREYEQLIRQKKMDEDEKARLLAEFQQLKATRDAEINEYEELQRRLQQTESECGGLRRECDSIRSRLGLGSEWEMKHNSIHEEKVRLGRDVDHWKSQVDSHGDTVEEWKQKHQSLLQDWEARHQDMHEAMEVKHRQIHEEWQQKHNRMEVEWKQKHQEAENEKAQIAGDLNRVQADFQEEQRLREDAAAKHRQVSNDMDRTSADLNQLQLLCHQHASSKQEAERIHMQLQQELRRFQGDFQKVEQDVAAEQQARLAAEQKHQAVEQDLQRMRADADRLRRECDEESMERDAIQKQLVDIAQQMALLEADYKKEIARLESEVDSYSKTRRTSIRISQTSTIGQLEDLRRRLVEVRRENADLKAECDAVDADSRLVREESQREVDKQSSLNQEKDTLLAEVDSLAAQGKQDDRETYSMSHRMSSFGSSVAMAEAAHRKVSVNLMDEKVELGYGGTMIDLTSDR